jgi:hypothetical protein
MAGGLHLACDPSAGRDNRSGPTAFEGQHLS